MLKICKELFDLWNKDSVKYCHWKSNEHLLEGLVGLTDLDIYVHYDDKTTAEEHLEKCGYIKFVPQKGARYPFVDEWIGFDYETGKLIHIHLHYKIITGTKYNKEYVFPLDDLIVSTRILNEEFNVYVASPDIEIIVLYSRIALKAKDKERIKVDSDYEKEITYLKERVNYEQVKSYCEFFFKDAGEKMYQFICKESLSFDEFNELYKIVDAWLKEYKKFSSFIVKIRYHFFKYRNLKNAVFNKYFKQHNITRKTLPIRGLSLCFIGADGSGKSTVSIEICKWLNWKVEGSRFYLGSGDHYNSLLKRVLSKASSKIASKKAQENDKIAKNDEAVKVSTAPKKKSLLKGILKSGFIYLQSVYLKKIATRSYAELKKAKKYAEKGAIAILDRFPQNQFAGIYDGPKIAARYPTAKNPFVVLNAKSEEKAIVKSQKYQPDVVFKLLLPPEESVRRKPDHTIEEVSAKAEITPKLVFENSIVYDIDATKPYDEELLEIKRLIWKVIKDNGNRI